MTPVNPKKRVPIRSRVAERSTKLPKVTTTWSRVAALFVGNAEHGSQFVILGVKAAPKMEPHHTRFGLQ